MIFLNSASTAAAALVFYLPSVCTHTEPEGKQRKAGVRNILKSSKKKILSKLRFELSSCIICLEWSNLVGWVDSFPAAQTVAVHIVGLKHFASCCQGCQRCNKASTAALSQLGYELFEHCHHHL